MRGAATRAGPSPKATRGIPPRAVMIRVTREHEATPSLITPMSQLSYRDGTFRATLTHYAAAMKKMADNEGVELVDVNTLSVAYYPRTLSRVGGGPPLQRSGWMASADSKIERRGLQQIRSTGRADGYKGA
jgi:hypothetical protein